MRYIISQTVITNRIPIAEDDDRSDEALQEDYENDPGSFEIDHQPHIDGDVFIGIENDED